MYRLLIVDNERHVVDGLFELFTNETRLNVEVYRAYHPEEALNWLGRTKMDIVLSDIRMPGMDGLQLQKLIVKQWPLCKVIFLTGYSDFDYIQDAMRHGACQYLLKTEGDEVLLEVVEQTIAAIEKELQMGSMVNKAKQQLKQALPMLQRDYLLDILEGNMAVTTALPEQFRNLEMSLDSHNRVLTLIGRVDEWDQHYSSYDRAPLLFAIQNIVEECLSPSCCVVTLVYERAKFIWLIQPSTAQQNTAKPVSEEEWKHTSRFIHGTLEFVQRTCKSLLKLSISITVANKAVEWSQAGHKFEQLKLFSSHGLGMGTELLLFEPEQENQVALYSDQWEYRSRMGAKRIELLAEYLENGQRYQFFLEYPKMMNITHLHPKAPESFKQEIKYSFSLMFIRYLNKWNLWNELGQWVDLNRLTHMGHHEAWNETSDYYVELAEQIFKQKRAGHEQQEKDVVKQIQRYVQANIAGDLSLTRIGEVVGHSSAYVSRLYKNNTGMNISDYINELKINKAKEMLVESSFKIQDISKLLGFDNDRYFYRYFKKAMSVTPQEYRDRESASPRQ